MCVAHPEPLADRLYNETKQFLVNHVTQLLERIQEGGDGQLIKKYYQYWSQYSRGVGYLHYLYFYLNQQYIKSQRQSDAEVIYGSNDANGSEQVCVRRRDMLSW